MPSLSMASAHRYSFFKLLSDNLQFIIEQGFLYLVASTCFTLNPCENLLTIHLLDGQTPKAALKLKSNYNL
jgi:hypothetical protein